MEDLFKKTAREIIDEIKSQKGTKTHDEYLKQYDPLEHNVHDKTKRRDKIITTSIGTESRSVARLSLPFQKIIVDRAAAFLIGEGVELTAQPEADSAEELMYKMLLRTWHDNKMDYKTRQMARIWMSETEVAELWYFSDKDPQDVWDGLELATGGDAKMKVQILAHSLGDRLYPYFDEYGDMIAFGHGYKVNKKEYFDVYTDKQILRYWDNNGWRQKKKETNKIGKIPVIYYTRENTEWSTVQPLIERYEEMISNFADANDYFASPMVKIKGNVTGFAEKGEQGKLIQMEENADASYLTWDQAPQAIQLEKETLQELIFAMTQTPDISFKQMKGLGTISGIALKLMFLDANLKTFKHQEEFGQGVQRRVNLLKKCMGIISTPVEDASSLQIEPKFKFYLPENTKEIIDTLITATGNKAIMSRKTAVNLNPLVIDPEQEASDIIDDDTGQFGNILDGV